LVASQPLSHAGNGALKSSVRTAALALDAIDTPATASTTAANFLTQGFMFFLVLIIFNEHPS
jgi:hypothetical protein